MASSYEIARAHELRITRLEERLFSVEKKLEKYEQPRVVYVERERERSPPRNDRIGHYPGGGTYYIEKPCCEGQ